MSCFPLNKFQSKATFATGKTLKTIIFLRRVDIDSVSFARAEARFLTLRFRGVVLQPRSSNY